MVETLVAVGSLVVTAIVAYVQLHKWLQERRAANRLENASALKAGAEREAIAVGGAERAVIVLQKVLELETARADRAEARVEILEASLDELEDRCRSAERQLREVSDALARLREERNA